jgi:hypothetical protein
VSRFQRKRLFVDATVQGALLVRIVVYWLLSLLTVSLLLICLQIVNGKAIHVGDNFNFAALWEEHVSVLVALLLILPMLMLDSLRLSNRFAGPFHRIRRTIHALSSGEAIEPLQFRSNDYWTDVAEDLNVLGERLRQANEQPASAALRQNSGPEDALELESASAK